MEALLKIEGHLAGLRAHVRSKPGMYFGAAGGRAVSSMLNDLAIAILRVSDRSRRPKLKIKIDETVPGRIEFRFEGVAGCDPSDPSGWMLPPSEIGCALMLVAAAGEECVVRVADKSGVGELRISDEEGVKFRRIEKRIQPGFAIVMRLHQPVFGPFTLMDFHQLGGKLRDLSILCARLETSLQMRPSMNHASWCYPVGLKGFVMEMDHSRWQLQEGVLEFHGERSGMKVEGGLRFLHAGVPEVRSWVNYHPTQGGAHYEGLGAALKALFPDPYAGCRRVTFVTNPDLNRRVLLPSPFVAALHLQVPRASFEGPTRDILRGDDVRDFVRDVAAAALPEQWAASQAERRRAGS